MKVIFMWDDNIETVPSDSYVDKWLIGCMPVMFEGVACGRLEVRMPAVGSCTQMNAVRVAVRDGKFGENDVYFEYNGMELAIDSDGRMEVWPEGFAGLFDKQLLALL